MGLKVFGDESTDETRSRAFAVAGVVGRENEWKAAEEEWLHRTGGAIFHAADCEHSGNLELYKDLTQIIARSRLAARAVSVDLIVFRELFPDTSTAGVYYLCFVALVYWLVENAASKLDEAIEFTFDNRADSGYNASRFYEEMARKRGWAARRFMHERLEFSRRENPRIQMADLFARECMKDLDSKIGPRKRPPRKSIIALQGKINLRVLDRKYFEGVHILATRLEGKHLANYIAWLSRKRRTDNASNRIEYIAFLEARGKSI